MTDSKTREDIRRFEIGAAHGRVAAKSQINRLWQGHTHLGLIGGRNSR